MARPLYLQVREALVQRLADGEWRAGAALPSEIALAAELGVSQGTVRKALDQLAAENLLERRQGRGTFVPEHTEARALFHFFAMVDPDGAPVIPEPVETRLALAAIPPAEARILGSGRRKVWRIVRTRAVDGRTAIVEHILIDPARFPRLTAATALPNALYAYYQAEGATVARADDRLTAVPAPADVARALGLAPGAPLLFARRIARDLRGAAIELRHSWFDTSAQAYRATLN